MKSGDKAMPVKVFDNIKIGTKGEKKDFENLKLLPG